MSKKLNFLAVLPLYGSIILLLWLFIKLIKKEINEKKFTLYFYSCGFAGAIVIALPMLFLKYQFNFSADQIGIAIIIVLIVGGYLWNLYTFILFNKKWDKLEIKKNSSYDI